MMTAIIDASPIPAAELAAPAVLDRLQRRAVLIGILGVVASIIGAIINLDQFLHSYLLAYMLWLGLSLGCLALLMLQYLSGGMWGFIIRRPLEAGTRNLPFMAVLFLPLLLGMKRLYPWAQSGFFEKLPEHDRALWKWHSYLQPGSWIFRAFVVLIVWNLLAFLLNRWSRWQDEQKLGVTFALLLTNDAGARRVLAAQRAFQRGWVERTLGGGQFTDLSVDGLGDEAWRIQSDFPGGQQATLGWRRASLVLQIHIQCIFQTCPSDIGAAARAWADAMDKEASTGP